VPDRRSSWLADRDDGRYVPALQTVAVDDRGFGAVRGRGAAVRSVSIRMALHWTGSAILLTVATVLGAAPATMAADRRPLACGDTITADARLTANLVDCPGDGLVIGADGVTLDLGGHTVDGDGAGDDVGIAVESHQGVTIANGAVREFTEGVLVVGASEIAIRRLTTSDQGHGGITIDGSRGVVVTDDVVRRDGAGIIVARSDTVRVRANRVSDSASGGISVFGSRHVMIGDNTVRTSRTDTGIGLFDGSSHSEVTGNRLSRNGAGIVLDGGASDNFIGGNSVARNASGVIVDVGTHDNRVVENLVADSAFEGIAVVGSDGNRIARNRVARNGGADAAGGIVVMPWPDDRAETSDANVLVDNLALDNGGDGIRVGAAQTANLLRSNRADRNSLLGIDAAPATIDAGGNRAARNGDSRQCVGVACGP
jgi:parallel beta-helix repeat protein